jgi:hypothetical protein
MNKLRGKRLQRPLTLLLLLIVPSLYESADSDGNVISIITTFTVYQSNLRGRYLAVLRAWSGSPEQQSAFRSEVMDILRQWAGAPV